MAANVQIYKDQGGALMTVGATGEIHVVAGGKITDDGTQASNIADLTITADLTGVDTGTDMTSAQATALGVDLAAIATKLNAVLAALEGVGITATS